MMDEAGEIQQIRDENLRAYQLLANRVSVLERKQERDNQKFKKTTMAIAGIAAVVAAGSLGLNLTEQNQEKLQSIAIGLIASGGSAAIGLPFVEEKDSEDDEEF